MSKLVADVLLTQRAVLLEPDNPFTWASGIKSPIYCDNRALLSSVSARNQVVEELTTVVSELGVDAVVGTATAGISWAAIIADRLQLPHGYVRSGNKSHGRQNQIEGNLKAGMSVVVIEDLISTGKSVNVVINALNAQGITVKEVVSIFTYKIVDNLENNTPLTSLTNIEELASEAVKKDYINENQAQEILKFISTLKK